MKTDDDGLYRRAIASYGASTRRKAAIYDQPSNGSAVHHIDGVRYVELINVRGTLAVYKETEAGRLTSVDGLPTGKPC